MSNASFKRRMAEQRVLRALALELARAEQAQPVRTVTRSHVGIVPASHVRGSGDVKVTRMTSRILKAGKNKGQVRLSKAKPVIRATVTSCDVAPVQAHNIATGVGEQPHYAWNGTGSLWA